MTASFSENAAAELFSRFPTGVVAVAGHDGVLPVGMVASSFAVGVSFDPPMVSLAVQNTSSSWPLLRQLPTLGISILGDNQEELCRRLASRSKRAERFNGVEYNTLSTGAITFDGAQAAMEVKVVREVPAGDHTMVLLEITDFMLDDSVLPIVFYRSQLTGVERVPAFA